MVGSGLFLVAVPEGTSSQEKSRTSPLREKIWTVWSTTTPIQVLEAYFVIRVNGKSVMQAAPMMV